MKRLQNFLFFVMLLFCFLAFPNHSSPAGGKYYTISPMPTLGKMQRIMVFAPHPDDETLACGGLIAEARRRNIPVTVVVITNGESFLYAAHIRYKKVVLPPSYFIAFGEERQKETLSAMELLGVPRENVIFFGYPDSDLHLLWEKYWSYGQLYTHSLLHTCFSPFPNIFHKKAPYCGASLLEDIKTLLRKYRPTDVFIPLAEDAHPTHWAVNSFCLMALEELKEKGNYSPNVYCYIVHRGRFPTPRGLHLQEALTPPSSLLGIGIHWRNLPLPRDIVELKYEAIKQYKSQLPPRMRAFMFAFARENELFSNERESLPVPLVHKNRIKIDGRSEDWVGIPPFIVDPQNDTLLRRLEISADIASIFTCQDKENLYIMMKSRGPISRNVKYYIHIWGMEEKEGNRIKLTKQISPKESTACLEVAIPLSSLGFNSRVFIGATTRYSNTTIDKTAYRIAILHR